MNSPNPSRNALLLNCKRKAEKSVLANFQVKRTRFILTYRRQQAWSLSDSIIYYITRNPSSPKCYEKMIQCCKYFFIKNPVIVVRNLHYGYNGWYTLVKVKSINLMNITSKIWVMNFISFANNDATCDKISSAIKCIHQSDIKEIRLLEQTISLNDLKLLSSKCENFYFDSATLLDENGFPLAIETIFNALLNVKTFHYKNDGTTSKAISFKTMSELLKIKHFLNLNYFIFNNVPEDFDLDCFYGYIKKNKKTRISIDFNYQISQAYRIRLQKIVNEIVATKKYDYKPPNIYFSRGEESIFMELRKLYIRG